MPDRDQKSTTAVTLTCVPADPKAGITIGELQAFFAEAERCGISDNVPLRVTTGFRSQLTKVTVTGG